MNYSWSESVPEINPEINPEWNNADRSSKQEQEQVLDSMSFLALKQQC